MAGYLGPSPVPQATQTRQTFIATAAQTSFPTGGYQAGYIDVFLNGVKLVDGTDYTATNGSDVVLTVGAAVSDTLEVVAYTAFEVLDQTFTGTTTTEGLTVTGAFTSLGIDDNATSTAMTLDSSGNVGIGTSSPAYKVVISANGASGIEFGPAYSGTSNLIQHYSRSGGVYVDAVNDAAQHRFNISGSERMRIDSSGHAIIPAGVTLGTAAGVYSAANTLDDYEEGTCQLVHGGVNMTGASHYEKVGRLVTVHFDVTSGAGSTTTNVIYGLPYAFEYPNGTVHVGYTTAAATIVGGYASNTDFRFITGGAASATNLAAGERVIGVVTYKTVT